MATKPTHNLIRDGIDSCADYVISSLKKKKVQCAVFVDRSGGVRVRTLYRCQSEDVHPRPEVERLWSSYRVSSKESAEDVRDYIRADLAARLEQLPVLAKAAA